LLAIYGERLYSIIKKGGKDMTKQQMINEIKAMIAWFGYANLSERTGEDFDYIERTLRSDSSKRIATLYQQIHG